MSNLVSIWATLDSTERMHCGGCKFILLVSHWWRHIATALPFLLHCRFSSFFSKLVWRDILTHTPGEVRTKLSKYLWKKLIWWVLGRKNRSNSFIAAGIRFRKLYLKADSLFSRLQSFNTFWSGNRGSVFVVRIILWFLISLLIFDKLFV